MGESKRPCPLYFYFGGEEKGPFTSAETNKGHVSDSIPKGAVKKMVTKQLTAINRVRGGKEWLYSKRGEDGTEEFLFDCGENVTLSNVQNTT